MDKIRTVSDTKRDFYSDHTRPINSVYRRVVEELLVEMHLLSVNVDFRYDPIYALGVVTAFERFMEGYQPEQDKESIFAALCKSVHGSAEQYRQDAQQLLSWTKNHSGEELLAWFSEPTATAETQRLWDTVNAIAQNANFKYSRLFAIGLFTMLAEANAEFVTDSAKRHDAVNTIAEKLNLPKEKMQKDLDLYRSNLEKMEQLLAVLEDTLEADRKKRAKAA